MKLIVGLGNPESQYEYTRHNLGFLVVKSIAQEQNLKFKKSAVTQAMEVKVVFEGEPCSLMLPLTYMNNSGLAVKAWITKKDLNIQDVLIVYDDLALDFGTLRLRPSGSHGGHNGIRSIIEQLGSSDFARLRLGIGKPNQHQDTADYVLSDFTSGEKKILPDFINEAVACTTSWVKQGTKSTMNLFNKKRKDNE